MTTYISILRGINVSGQKKILMADLKALYENLGFSEVVTYIQSGNVVFKSVEKEEDKILAEKIKQSIQQKYNFEVPVIIRSIEEVTHVIESNPFLAQPGIDPEKLHVTFLEDTPLGSSLDNIQTYNYPPDVLVISGREVFLHCPVNYGETKFSNKFLESKLKVSATTRNWKTINKLHEIATKPG